MLDHACRLAECKDLLKGHPPAMLKIRDCAFAARGSLCRVLLKSKYKYGRGSKVPATNNAFWVKLEN